MMSTTDTGKVARHSRTERLEARISKEQKRLLAKAAAIEGRSLSDFVIGSAQEAARKTVREHEVLVLGARDQESFVAALLEPTPPGERLRNAALRYLERRES